MLRGHDTLTRLIGKRRKLSLSALSPNKRVLSVVKKEVEEEISSVATFVKDELVTIVKNESIEPRCPAESSVGQQRATGVLIEALAGSAGISLCKIEEVVMKSETQSAVRSQSTYDCDLASTSRNGSWKPSTTGLKPKSKQATLSRFFSPGMKKLFIASSSVQGQTVVEEEHRNRVTVKIEDAIAERPLQSPASSRSRLKLKRVKTEIRQEIDLKNLCSDLARDSQEFNEVHGCTSTSVGNSLEEAGTSTQQTQVVPKEEKLGRGDVGSLNSSNKENTDCCACSCHYPSRKTEDLRCSEKNIEIEALIHGVDSVGDHLANAEAGLGASFQPRTSQDMSDTITLPSQIPESSVVGVLETRIVGRRYNRGVSCEVGMKVTVLREPNNPVDPNAIKIVPLESPLGPALGHLPKEISAQLSSLLDKDTVHVQGFVASVPDRLYGDVPLKLSLAVSKSCGDLSLLDVEESLQRMNFAFDKSSVPQSVAAPVSKYQQNFVAVVQTVLGRDSHLFTVQEKEYLRTFFTLSGDAQRLFIRLYQRKGPWFRVSTLSYKDVADDSLAFKEVADSGYMTSDCGAEEEPEVSLRARIELLTVPELKQLASSLQKKGEAATARREELITLIISTALEKHVHVEGLSSRRRTFLEMVTDITGPCIRVSQEAEFLLWRVQRLFFLDTEGDLSSFLVVDRGRVKYPRYKCSKSRHVFPTREILVAYEQALEVAQGMDMSLERNDVERALSFLRRAREELGSCEVVVPDADRIPPFLARFSASYVYKNVITVGVSILERERRYKEAVDALKQLLKSEVRSGRWGYWTLRLSINLDHLGCKEESLQVAEKGVNQPWIRGGDKVALQRRVVRLGKPPRRWKKPAYADALNRKCNEIQILGRPLNSVAGKKSRFYGYDGIQCSVEELALQYYASEEGGGWEGVHCEGGVLLTLFGLLMWDVLFADVPDVFQSPFQAAPLDLNTELFYPSRQELIETRLAEIAGGNVEKIISQTWNENFGTMCNGVKWERHSLAQLLVIARCIGAVGLSHVCRLLAEDHAGWRGGMPDLLLWRTTNVSAPPDSSLCPDCGCSSQGNDIETKSSTDESCASAQGTSAEEIPSSRKSVKWEAKLAEVKGPRDRLSEQQLAWIWILMNGGLSVEVCKVVESIKCQ
ncbi:hypothetical protein R1flu_019252 [Riccia fluitans]|uniref:Fanconi-associated nuclease n=1 Tax=Riccia fluitans TaxID=41844 RepID=A0ABD1ZLZ6_9MARC